MNRRITALLGILLTGFWVFGQVVINELYYDHPGSDTGHEWVELYNAGAESIDITGYTIEKAGTTFCRVFTFPEYMMGSHQYLIVGEDQVEEAEFTATLVFQNGGGMTDGVRILSADSLYTDTVLYDEPNSNELQDDLGITGSSFAPDVIAGHSLIRVENGVDSNSGEDWQESHHPSPGSGNIISVDLMISNAELTNTGMGLELFTVIHNLSTAGVDNSVGNLDIYLDNSHLESLELGSIEGNGSREYTVVLTDSIMGYHQIRLILNSIYDNNMGNNESGCSLLNGSSAVHVNELMINPELSSVEWLELFIHGGVDNYVDNLRIIDAAGSEGVINSSELLTGYQVICENAVELSVELGLTQDQLVESTGFPTLNNDGDTVYLADEWGTILDSVSYSGCAGVVRGRSWEKIKPAEAESDWGICIAERGHTAGTANSIMPGIIDVAIEFVGLFEYESCLQHHLMFYDLGLNSAEAVEMTVKRYNESGMLEEEGEFFIDLEGDSTEVIVETVIPAEGYYQYEYVLFAEDDCDSSNNTAESSYSHNSLGWVINEIMYRPCSGDPEWLEIKRNNLIYDAVSLQLITGADSCTIEVDSEYTVVTGSEADKEMLQEQYGGDLSVVTGLGSLTDDGKQLSLLDNCGNLFEEFVYDPQWNDSQQGVSIERVNPQLPAYTDNFSRCVQVSTPGAENSVFTPVPVNVQCLQINPPAFNPRAGEHAVITYSNEENLNLVKLEIYDLKGRSVCLLADHEYQSHEGSYFWDGRNDDGSIVRRGVYIILFESSAAGKIYKEKSTVVVKR